jgi:hypothetical protein
VFRAGNILLNLSQVRMVELNDHTDAVVIIFVDGAEVEYTGGDAKALRKVFDAHCPDPIPQINASRIATASPGDVKRIAPAN